MVATFYDYPLAFNPAKAKLVLLEKHFPFKNKVVDIFNGQSLSPSYLKINPHATVPVLVDGDVTITESRKILEYVDGKDGKPLGGSAVDRQKVATWLDKIDPWDGNLFFFANLPADVAKSFGGLGEFKVKYAEARAKQHPDLAQTYADKIAGMKAFGASVADPAAVAANKTQLVALLDEAEAALAGSKFLAGEEYSIADAAFTPVLYRVAALGKAPELIDTREHLKAYYAGLKERKSFETTFAVSSSNLKTTLLVAPALFKAWRAKKLHWY